MALGLGSEAGNVATSDRGSTIDTIRAEKSATDARIPNTKALAEEAKARQAANNAAGNGSMATGAAQQAQGQAQIGLGTGLIAIGTAMCFIGSPAESAVRVKIGTAMITSGVTSVGTGAVSLASANESIQKGTTQLAKAAQDGIISREQASIANKEMIRSQIFQTKINMLEGAMQDLERDGKLKGATGEDLTQEQINKLKEGGQTMFDKAFDAGADALANNGIMSLKDGADTRYFMLNADGNPAEVNVMTGADGQAQLDAAGRLQVDLDNPVLGRPALSDEQNLELKLDFALMNQMKDMITGTPADPNAVPPKAAQPPLARIEIDPNTGEVKAGTFDFSNPQHLKEFAELTHAASKNPPPLKYFKEGEELFFQKWDWAKNEGIGEKVSIKEMSGGDVDKSNPDWKNIAKAKAQAAFDKVGLGSSSDTYKLLQPLAAESEENDYNPINLNSILNRTNLDPVGLRSNNSSSSANTGTGVFDNRNTLSRFA